MLYYVLIVVFVVVWNVYRTVVCFYNWSACSLGTRHVRSLFAGTTWEPKLVFTRLVPKWFLAKNHLT